MCVNACVPVWDTLRYTLTHVCTCMYVSLYVCIRVSVCVYVSRCATKIKGASGMSTGTLEIVSP